ncbi:hypothetical protein [Macrococcus bovicus]|uniref:Uncharacterized protein n=1 Tax=Macrococcus bovicus TaxID=69968 RepID=A0A4R6BYR5_9STAP|nr:hypothetical protein [Macrococcus bovicus]TDM13432.1 hypothetical protein ERX55_09285 [Macrococcus bovicus]
MNQQLIKARDAVDVALACIDEIQKMTSNAKAWSWFDILGNGFIGSFYKRQNIKNINDKMTALQEDLQRVVAELEDINLTADFNLSDTSPDLFLDVFFDNIVTDIRVHQELSDLNHELENTAEQLNIIARVIDNEF